MMIPRLSGSEPKAFSKKSGKEVISRSTPEDDPMTLTDRGGQSLRLGFEVVVGDGDCTIGCVFYGHRSWVVRVWRKVSKGNVKICKRLYIRRPGSDHAFIRAFTWCVSGEHLLVIGGSDVTEMIGVNSMIYNQNRNYDVDNATGYMHYR
jgi:hypothetical protein